MKMSSKDNPHSVTSILASTPRSKGKKSRKRRLHTDSLAEPQGAVATAAVGKDDSTGIRPCVKDCVLSEFIKIADSIPDIKYRLLDPSGTEAESTLEVTPATCTVTQLGLMDVVRLLVSATSGLCQYQVMYPVPRCVDQLKRESTM